MDMLNWTQEKINQKYEELCPYDYDSYYGKDLNGKIEEFATITSLYQEANYAYLAYKAMSEHGGEFNISKIFSLRLLKNHLFKINNRLKRDVELEINKIRALN